MNQERMEYELNQVFQVATALERDYAGIVTFARCLPEHEAVDSGADWILDVYFVPSDQLLAFEDRVDVVATGLFLECGVKLLVVSHTDEATELYHLPRLQRVCPEKLIRRLADAVCDQWSVFTSSALVADSAVSPSLAPSAISLPHAQSLGHSGTFSGDSWSDLSVVGHQTWYWPNDNSRGILPAYSSPLARRAA